MTIENIPLSSVSDEHFAGQEKSWKGQRGGENERSYRVKDHKQSLKGKDARVLRKGGAEKERQWEVSRQKENNIVISHAVASASPSPILTF